MTVFEKSKQFSRFGGPIQLASNALSCINALSPELFEQIMVLFLRIYFLYSFFLLQIYDVETIYFHWYAQVRDQGRGAQHVVLYL